MGPDKRFAILYLRVNPQLKSEDWMMRLMAHHPISDIIAALWAATLTQRVVDPSENSPSRNSPKGASRLTAAARGIRYENGIIGGR